MYERMLDKQNKPAFDDMAAYCGKGMELFIRINEWLSDTCSTVQEITFPYGNKYGWAVAHRKKKKLICNVFAENGAFTVMIRLSNAQFHLATAAPRAARSIWYMTRLRKKLRNVSTTNTLVVMADGSTTALPVKLISVIYKNCWK